MIKAVRGTRDLLPPDTDLWNFVEARVRDIFRIYNFHEIRTPLFEATELFARGVGEETDIVSKEMFTWEDRARAASEKAQSLTLRPEATSGIVRAYIEHDLNRTGLLHKLYMIGPMFRRERPQKGRYRQFFQIDAEIIGPPSSASGWRRRCADDVMYTLTPAYCSQARRCVAGAHQARLAARHLPCPALGLLFRPLGPPFGLKPVAQCPR